MMPKSKWPDLKTDTNVQDATNSFFMDNNSNRNAIRQMASGRALPGPLTIEVITTI